MAAVADRGGTSRRGWTIAMHAGRFGLALILLATGIGKLLDIEGFAAIVAQYRVLPDPLTLPAAWGLAVGELALSAWLIAGARLRLAAAASAALHLAYMVWSVAALLRGLDLANCGCFGTFWARPLGLSTAIEDAALAALSAALFLGARTRGVP